MINLEEIVCLGLGMSAGMKVMYDEIGMEPDSEEWKNLISKFEKHWEYESDEDDSKVNQILDKVSHKLAAVGTLAEPVTKSCIACAATVVVSALVIEGVKDILD